MPDTGHTALTGSAAHCAIGMGGNLGDAPATLAQALAAMAQLPGTSLVAASRLYRSAAIGPAGQPDYANAVALLSTTLSPWQLLDQLQALESAAGRVRDIRWGARTLDLDLLLYGHERIHDERLTVPHPELMNRAFVLRPLLDIHAHGHWPDDLDIVTLLHQPDIARQPLTTWPEPCWQTACEQHSRFPWRTS